MHTWRVVEIAVGEINTRERDRSAGTVRVLSDHPSIRAATAKYQRVCNDSRPGVLMIQHYSGEGRWHDTF